MNTGKGPGSGQRPVQDLRWGGAELRQAGNRDAGRHHHGLNWFQKQSSTVKGLQLRGMDLTASCALTALGLLPRAVLQGPGSLQDCNLAWGPQLCGGWRSSPREPGRKEPPT